ncbi:MAG: dihydroorotase [Alphaproteobacteria bacterium]
MAPVTDRLTIRRPDDWHVHLRDGALLSAVLPFTARDFGRAIVMPNLKPPVVTVREAGAYRARILEAVPQGASFEPLMTLYLTDRTDPKDVAAGARDKAIAGVKLYPAGATTNSEAGVTDLRKVEAVLAQMEKLGLPLLVHGEVTDPEVDVFDREAVFIDRVLLPLTKRHPGLKIVLEHVTTEEGVAFVRGAPATIAATITAHHLMINRNAMFEGGLRPNMYCLPVAKREQHRLALAAAATSGSPKFFLGTDSAPHLRRDKESACGCAGLFTAPVALACYAEVFDRAGALDRFEGFASLHGPAFYGLAPNEERITLMRMPSTVRGTIDVPREGAIVPFRAGESIAWSISENGK